MADDIKNAPVSETESSDEIAASRRKFTKTGIVGAAVVFSLANRSAWGTGSHTHPAGCVSLMNSLNFASMAPGSEKEWQLNQCINSSHTHKHWHGNWSHTHEHSSHDHTH